MYRHIPFTILAMTVFIVLAVVLLVTGCLIAGINVWTALTSYKAIFIYVILFILIVVAAFKYFTDKNTR